MSTEIGAHIFEEISAKEDIKVSDVMEKLATMLLDRNRRSRTESVYVGNKKEKVKKKGCC